MPTVGLTVGKWFLAATVAPSTSYDCRCELGSVDRREFDVSLGYEILPRLYLSLGYKEGRQSKIVNTPESSEAKAQALLIGAQASANLTDTISLYGNAAYGFTQYRSDLPDPDNRSHYDGGYQIGEVGLSWRFGQLLGNAFQNASVALGYRFQSLLVNDTPNRGADGSVQRTDLRSNTSGPVVTLVAFF